MTQGFREVVNFEIYIEVFSLILDEKVKSVEEEDVIASVILEEGSHLQSCCLGIRGGIVDEETQLHIVPQGTVLRVLKIDLYPLAQGGL